MDRNSREIKMENKKFKSLWEAYQKADSDKCRLEMMREFMMSSSFDELLGMNTWTQWLKNH